MFHLRILTVSVFVHLSLVGWMFLLLWDAGAMLNERIALRQNANVYGRMQMKARSE
jgi:hypothetical protein